MKQTRRVRVFTLSPSFFLCLLLVLFPERRWPLLEKGEMNERHFANVPSHMLCPVWPCHSYRSTRVEFLREVTTRAFLCIDFIRQCSIQEKCQSCATQSREEERENRSSTWIIYIECSLPFRLRSFHYSNSVWTTKQEHDQKNNNRSITKPVWSTTDRKEQANQQWLEA